MSKAERRVTIKIRNYPLWENDNKYQKPCYKNWKNNKTKEIVNFIMWQTLLIYRNLANKMNKIFKQHF